MAVIKVNNSTEKYEQIAINLNHRNELTGRGRDVELTKKRANNIKKNIVDLNLSLQNFVDIGCGDGSFLIEMRDQFDYSIGVLPTYTEMKVVKKLLNEYADQIEIKEGLATEIPLHNQSVDFLLCNSVLHGVGFNSETVDTSLEEFKRVLKPEGLLYIGEIPEVNELDGRTYGTSIVKFLIWTLLNRGLIKCLKQIILILKSMLTKSNYIIQPTNMFFENNFLFKERLKRNGFTIFKTFESNSNNRVDDSYEVKMRRLDYLCKVRSENTVEQ